MIPFALPAFFGTLAGKVAFWGGVSAIALGVYGCEVAKQREIGAKRIVQKIEKQGEVVAKKAAKARAGAERLSDKGVKEWCRDC